MSSVQIAASARIPTGLNLYLFTVSAMYIDLMIGGVNVFALHHVGSKEGNAS